MSEETEPEYAPKEEFFEITGPWVSADQVREKFNLSPEELSELIEQNKIFGMQFGADGEYFFQRNQFLEKRLIPDLEKILVPLRGFFEDSSLAFMLNVHYDENPTTYWEEIGKTGAAEWEEWAHMTVQHYAS